MPSVIGGSSPRRALISACMIVQDEQERLPAALDSLGFCDEIVLVDGGSTDRTVEIAEAAGAKVIENPWQGYAAQRNVALDHATGEWVLELDADERVSPQLRASIERLLQTADPGAKIAVCALRNRFLGGLLGPSAKYPAYRSRLFRRGAYRHDESRQVHEGIEPRERPAVLDGDLEHELARTPREALGDAWRYARLESRHISRPARARAYLVGIVLRPAAKIAYRTIVDGGWRDGWRGFAKIALDAASDTLVWTLVLLGRGGEESPAMADRSTTAAAAGEGHFGRRPAGPPKVVAIAARGRPAATARTWLAPLSAAGFDAMLLTDEQPSGGTMSTRTVTRLGPLRTARALDTEMGLRTIGLVVAFGARAKLLHRLLPHTLRPAIAGVDSTLDAHAALRALQASAAPAADPAPTDAGLRWCE